MQEMGSLLEVVQDKNGGNYIWGLGYVLPLSSPREICANLC